MTLYYIFSKDKAQPRIKSKYGLDEATCVYVVNVGVLSVHACVRPHHMESGVNWRTRTLQHVVYVVSYPEEKNELIDNREEGQGGS